MSDFSIADHLDTWIKSQFRAVHTVLPGRINAYHGHDVRKADVDLLMTLPVGENNFVEVNPLLDIPVIFPGSARFNFVYSLQKGDPCLILFCENDIGNYLGIPLESGSINLASAKKVDPANNLKFKLQHAVCLPFSINPDAYIPTAAPSSIVENDGVIEINGNTKQFVTHAELSSLLATFMTALNLHTHAVTALAASTGPMTTLIDYPTLVPISLDISTATTTKVKAGV